MNSSQTVASGQVEIDRGFYARLPDFSDLNRLTDPGRFVPAPASWCVVIADVVNSTVAIEAGRYKDVNVVGALSIVALLNIAGDVELPYAFGGDGAILLIPPSLRLEAEDVLIDVQLRARREFQLELRTGIVPIGDLYADGEELWVARWAAAPEKRYVQALFLGGALTRAERLIRDPATAPKYVIQRTNGMFQADYTGFSCRWKEVPSPHAESVCLLVQAARGSTAPEVVYRGLLGQIDDIYGDARQRHPITPGGLHAALNDRDLDAEARIAIPDSDQSPALLRRQRAAYRWRTRLQIAATHLWMALGTRTGAERTRRWFPRAPADMSPMDWGRYKEYLIETSDTQKLDGTLRLVMSGYPEQRARLTEFLEAEYQAGHLSYGIHASTGALVTCLVYQPNGNQVHFVDGADGGYALAAREMKERQARQQSVAPLSPPPLPVR